MSVEQWRDYDDRYSVSDRGRIRDNKTNRIAKQWTDRADLWTVTIHGRPRRTAMIVAEVWLGRKTGEHVYYRRGIDPRASNLIVAKPRGRRRWNAKLTATKARAIARSRLPLAELAAKYRVSVSCIANVKHGHCWAWATGITREDSRPRPKPCR